MKKPSSCDHIVRSPAHRCMANQWSNQVPKEALISSVHDLPTTPYFILVAIADLLKMLVFINTWS